MSIDISDKIIKKVMMNFIETRPGREAGKYGVDLIRVLLYQVADRGGSGNSSNGESVQPPAAMKVAAAQILRQP